MGGPSADWHNTKKRRTRNALQHRRRVRSGMVPRVVRFMIPTRDKRHWVPAELPKAPQVSHPASPPLGLRRLGVFCALRVFCFPWNEPADWSDWRAH
jgi:hypothetical protein